MTRWVLALLFLCTPAWGAMEFNGSTEQASSSSPPSVSYPFSMCCWFKSDSATAQQGIFGIGDTAGNVNWVAMQAAGHQAGDPVGATATTTTQGNAFTSTGYSAGTWHHACAVFTSITSRTAYIDGGSAVTNTDSVEPTSLDSQAIGVIKRQTDAAFFDGSIAECGYWTNLALTAGDAAQLAKGFAPSCVARQRGAGGLGNYFPIVREVTTVNDIFNVPDPLTLTGGTVSDHPRIINCQ